MREQTFVVSELQIFQVGPQLEDDRLVQYDVPEDDRVFAAVIDDRVFVVPAERR